MTKKDQSDVKFNRDALLKAFDELNSLLPEGDKVDKSQNAENLEKAGSPMAPNKPPKQIPYEFGDVGDLKWDDESMREMAKNIQDKISKNEKLTAVEQLVLSHMFKGFGPPAKEDDEDDEKEDDTEKSGVKKNVDTLVDTLKAQPQSGEMMDASEFLYKLAVAFSQTQQDGFETVKSMVSETNESMVKSLDDRIEALERKQDKMNSAMAKMILNMSKSVVTFGEQQSAFMSQAAQAPQSQNAVPLNRFQGNHPGVDGALTNVGVEAYGGLSKAQFLDTMVTLALKGGTIVTDEDVYKAEQDLPVKDNVRQVVIDTHKRANGLQ